LTVLSSGAADADCCTADAAGDAGEGGCSCKKLKRGVEGETPAVAEVPLTLNGVLREGKEKLRGERFDCEAAR
jgi:hypothetical protein